MDYRFLNSSTIMADDPRYSDAWRRVLARLGDYTAIIVRALHMRPSEVALLAQTPTCVLVRITTAGEHVVLRIAPEASLSGDVFFSRAMAAHQLPAARPIRHDLSRTLVPFDYTLERFVAGSSAARLVDPALLHALGRQVGRALRRMHRVAAPGWGRPGVLGRWPTPDWRAALAQLHVVHAPPPTDALLFSDAERAVVAGLLDAPALACAEPRLMHGAIGPRAVRCTIGEHIQLEALVDPGPVVGGDGLLDLALGLDPAYPAPWRAGLLDGYAGLAPLSAAERARLPLLRLLACYWSACRCYARAEPHVAAYAEARALLAQLGPEMMVEATIDE